MEAFSNNQKRIHNLIEKLRDPDRKERLEARKQLILLSEDALPAITFALFDADENIRWQAAKILSRLRIPITAEALVRALADDEHFGVRWLAAEGLIGMKQDCLEAILQALIKRPESVWLRQGAHHVLHSLYESGLTGEALDDVLHALEASVPSIETPAVAYKALEKLSRLCGGSTCSLPI